MNEILISTIIKFNNKKCLIAIKYFNYEILIKLAWTITPALVLIFIAFSSFKLLYLIDKVSNLAIILLIRGY